MPRRAAANLGERRGRDEAGRARRTAAADERWKQIQELFPVWKDAPK
jgi:hypothetical protein